MCYKLNRFSFSASLNKFIESNLVIHFHFEKKKEKSRNKSSHSEYPHWTNSFFILGNESSLWSADWNSTLYNHNSSIISFFCLIRYGKSSDSQATGNNLSPLPKHNITICQLVQVKKRSCSIQAHYTQAYR